MDGGSRKAANGQKRTQTFDLKTEGDKVTGTMVGMGGREMKLEDGKINGDNITFTSPWNSTGIPVRSTIRAK